MSLEVPSGPEGREEKEVEGFFYLSCFCRAPGSVNERLGERRSCTRRLLWIVLFSGTISCLYPPLSVPNCPSGLMGAALCCCSDPVDLDGEVNLYHFDLLRAVGKGAFGKVSLYARTSAGTSTDYLRELGSRR